MADAIANWAPLTKGVATAILWLLWGVVLVGLLTARPLSLTVVRTGVPLALAVAVLAFANNEGPSLGALAALAVTSTCVVLASTPSIGIACAQGVAYGDEERFPLAVPPALFIGILPLAVLGVGAGIAVGPLLLASGRTAAGFVAVALGLPLATLLFRSLHQLSRRWLILVPAGIVIHDPMTLTDPFLFTRDSIAGFGIADARKRVPTDAEDLRLGATRGSLALLLSQETDIYRRSRRRSIGCNTSLILVAPVARQRVLDRAAARRIVISKASPSAK